MRGQVEGHCFETSPCTGVQLALGHSPGYSSDSCILAAQELASILPERGLQYSYRGTRVCLSDGVRAYVHAHACARVCVDLSAYTS